MPSTNKLHDVTTKQTAVGKPIPALPRIQEYRFSWPLTWPMIAIMAMQKIMKLHMRISGNCRVIAPWEGLVVESDSLSTRWSRPSSERLDRRTLLYKSGLCNIFARQGNHPK